MATGNARTEPKEILGLNRITKKRLLQLCKKDKLYQTPSLNDVLYLHYQGFQCIECLEEYTELKCLWLECNALSEIQGLENQSKLKCLYLQSNLIRKIENLENCRELDTINLSQNQIRKIENINSDILPVLNTLILTSNYITSFEGLMELENCKNLSVVDLANNRINDILVVKIFSKMPELKVLILQGNPVVSQIPQYRKTLILECEKLTYLDSRPVFPKDRACAEAWKRGGYQEERNENERWNRKDRRKIRGSVNATIRMRNKYRKPEDQLTLLGSSDSEDEEAANKRQQQQEQLDAGVKIELGIWDEVSGKVDDNKSETASSSDTNASSSISVASSVDSNAESSNVCAEKKAKVLSENKEEEEKNLGLPTEKTDNEDLLLPVESMSMGEILEYVGKERANDEQDKQKNQNTENEDLKNSEELNQISEENANHNLDNVLKADSGHLIDKDENALTSHATEQKQEVLISSEDSDDSDSKNETYEPTIKAVYDATMNNLSVSNMGPKETEKRVYLQIETNDENYEAMDEMEAVMDTLVAQEDKDRESIRQKNADMAEPPRADEYDSNLVSDLSQVNEEFTQHFERMSSNMDIALAQFEKDQEERREVMETLFNLKAAEPPESSSGESETDIQEINDENLRIERMVQQWDRLTRLKGGIKTKANDGNLEASNSMADEKKQEFLSKICENNTGETQLKSSNIRRMSGVFENKLEITPEKANEDFQENQAESKESFAEYNLEIKTEEKYEFKEICLKKLEILWQKELEDLQKNQVKEKLSSEKQFGVTLKETSQEEQKIYETTSRTTMISDSSMNLIQAEDPVSHQTKVSLVENTETLKLIEKLDTCSNDHDTNFYVPLDVASLTRVSNEALESFERETKSLQKLLQKLEDTTYQKFPDFSEANQYEKDKEEKIPLDIIGEFQKTQEDKTEEQNTDKPGLGEKAGSEALQEEENLNTIILLCEQTVENLIESLDFVPQKPKSYEFPEDLKEEQEYLTEEDEPRELPLSRTIRSVIDSFNDIFKPLNTDSAENATDLESQKRLKEKTILNDLIQTGNLQQFNADTHESLDAQLAEYEKEKSKMVRGIVDRVYAKKERYHDTIELIDGKLMVVNKDTGELTELPPSKCNVSVGDSDNEDYDTAESDGEAESGACCSKPKTRNVKINVSPRQWGPFGVQNYKSCQTQDSEEASCSKPIDDENNSVRKWENFTARNYKSMETLMHEALNENHPHQAYFEDDDEEEEDFYSLDVSQCNSVYGNIEKETFHAMTFDHLNLSEQDESHIVQCARSYEELRHVIKTQKEESDLSPEESELVEKMIEGKPVREMGQIYENDTSGEDESIRKLLERTRAVNAREMGTPKTVERTGTPYRVREKPFTIWQYNPTRYDEQIFAENLTEVDMGKFYTFEGNSCTEISASGSSTSQHEEEIFNTTYEFIGSKDIKESLNRHEQQLENKLAGDQDMGIFSPLLDRSENEKNEIEFNIDEEALFGKQAMEKIMENAGEKKLLEELTDELNLLTATGLQNLETGDDYQQIVDEGNLSNPQENLTNFQESKDFPENMTESTSTIEDHENMPSESLDNPKGSIYDAEQSKPKDQDSEQISQQTTCSLNADTVEENSNNFSEFLKEASQLNSLLGELQSEILDSKIFNSNSNDLLTEDIKQKPSIEDNLNENTLTMPHEQLDEGECNTAEMPDFNSDMDAIQTEQDLPSTQYNSIELPDFSSDLINANDIQEKTDPTQTEEDNRSPDSLPVNILECNLEILGNNDEIIDTITVNAEIHYEN